MPPHSDPSEPGMLHAPAPLTFVLPNDWGQLATYPATTVPAVALGIAGLIGAAGEHRLGTSAVAAASALLLAPAIWVAVRVISYARADHAVVFESDAVQIPRLTPFGKAHRIAYRDVQSMERVRGGLRLQLASGVVRVPTIYRGLYARVLAALELRVGYAMERDGRFAEAVAMYERASAQYEPPLLARLALASEKNDELSEAQDYYLEAEWELLDAYGPDHPAVRALRAELARFRAAHPDVDSFGLSDQEDLVDAKRARLERQPHDEPKLRDD